MMSTHIQRRRRGWAILLFFSCAAIIAVYPRAQSSAGTDGELEASFEKVAKPFFKQNCIRCHEGETSMAGVRIDQLDAKFEDRQIATWEAVRNRIDAGTMPPKGAKPQPSDADRERMTKWIDDALEAARARRVSKNGLIRRLTVAQYRNTLRELLMLEDDLSDILPPDAVSKDGFLNNHERLELSPLLTETYFEIAEKALNRVMIDPQSKPSIQNFRLDFGSGINPSPISERLVLGANSTLLPPEDFIVEQLTAKKAFPFEPFFMRTKYRFIEGYQGNDTVRGWRDFDSIYHAVFADFRGSNGYPKGKAYETVPAGLLLRPAIPNDELFGADGTYGPKANFKIAVRELPDDGRFRVTVTAAKYDDGLLLDRGAGPADGAGVVVNGGSAAVRTPGIYQVDLYPALPAAPPVPDTPNLNEGLVGLRALDDKPGTGGFVGKSRFVDSPFGKAIAQAPQQRRRAQGRKGGPQVPAVVLNLGDRRFTGGLQQAAFLVVRLDAGTMPVSATIDGVAEPAKIVLTPLPETHEAARRFLAFEKRSPKVGVHVGFRRDCGSSLVAVGEPQTVAGEKLARYVFEGAMRNFPNAEVEKDNVNYLAGVREIGVRSEYTDGRDMPRLLIRSVEFEGPLHETWPPPSYRNIFIDYERKSDRSAYARRILRHFATRAYRRPVTAAEEEALVAVYRRSAAAGRGFEESVKDALLVALTSPQFLFLIENSSTPGPEPLDNYELASKLSYFLWNGPPDRRTLQLAAAGTLRKQLDAETERMIADPKFSQFINEFTSQWLSLDKLQVLEPDHARFPKLTREARAQLKQEPVEFLRYLIKNNLPAQNLVQSDFIVANEAVAGYYDLGEKTESGFKFAPIKHDRAELGGLLTQAALMAGLSDGRESNPVKRGAWLARKIIAEPPADPPPNVPALKEATKDLTLRQRLELHRDVVACRSCHAKIDPWGVALEEFDAGGRLKKQSVDARSMLPDKTQVSGANDLKRYLAGERIDQVAFSFLKHLSTYASGRSLTYSELGQLKKEGLKLKADGYRMKDMIRYVVKSPIFLEK